MILKILLASSLSALLYRLGGWSKGNKAFRRFGCPLAAYGLLWLLLPGLGLKQALFGLFAYVLTSLALSTYNDWLAPDKSSENWLCWLVTGLLCGLAAFPLFWAGITWYSIIIRAVVLGALTMFWSEKISKDIWEEAVRGFLLTATIPILLV